MSGGGQAAGGIVDCGWRAGTWSGLWRAEVAAGVTPRRGPGAGASRPGLSRRLPHSAHVTLCRLGADAGGRCGARVLTRVQSVCFVLVGVGSQFCRAGRGRAVGAGRGYAEEFGGFRTADSAARAVGAALCFLGCLWGSEETLGACGTWSRVRSPCRVWTLALAARGGASGARQRGPAALLREWWRQRLPGRGPSQGGRPRAACRPGAGPRARRSSLTLRRCRW